MIFMLFAIAIAALFFVGSLILLRWGQHLGRRYRERSEGTGGFATVEGAIFGLMGLLLAFTISGALQRFDDRRQLVIQEATTAATAYDRLSLFAGDDGRRLQGSLKEYVGARIELYRMPHDFLVLQRAEEFSDQQEKKVRDLKNRLWGSAVVACPQPNYRPACALSLPALNSLFEVALQRAGAAEKHPPQIVYFMLFGLGLGCSLLAGFGMAANAGRSWIHMVIFAGTLTVALYIVTDMEYPRLGLIRIESFDHFLADAYERMN
ncbi:bestrophin-like domain [Bradyrhizobium sp. USDA 4504]